MPSEPSSPHHTDPPSVLHPGERSAVLVPRSQVTGQARPVPCPHMGRTYWCGQLSGRPEVSSTNHVHTGSKRSHGCGVLGPRPDRDPHRCASQARFRGMGSGWLVQLRSLGSGCQGLSSVAASHGGGTRWWRHEHVLRAAGGRGSDPFLPLARTCVQWPCQSTGGGSMGGGWGNTWGGRGSMGKHGGG